ncbi:hypothetical protein [Bradyrhizobium sp. LMTR 3]|uniref:hypothetical protein n=1 Tax=Bradyrhizobium sp. LMTR 3 TaxID=189873 RepID=UPI0009FBD0F3|nr:hypothetical protein [Bradyrhizobium sp. LMTR 3]
MGKRFGDAALCCWKTNQAMALPIAFAIGATESIVGVGFFVPSTALPIATSAALVASGSDVRALWLAVTFGACFDDWISYAIGYFVEH